MVDVRPFKGIRYSALAGDQSELICPPFDVISPEHQADLFRRSRHNMVNLELPQTQPNDTETNNRYSRAGGFFSQLQESGILEREKESSLYLIRHTFEFEGQVVQRLGILACVRLEELDIGNILPHEETRPGPKVDRLAIMNTCHANFSPVMCLYEDSNGTINYILDSVIKEQPTVEFAHAEEHFALWVLTESLYTSEILKTLSTQPLFLADGHHRYETALNYRNNRRKEQRWQPDDAFNFQMMYLVSFQDPGLLMLAYHRAISGLDEPTLRNIKNRLTHIFDIETFQPGNTTAEEYAQKVAEWVEKKGKEGPAIGVLDPTGVHVLSSINHETSANPIEYPLEQWEGWVLQEKVLRHVLGERLIKHVNYFHNASEAMVGIQEGRYQMAFIMRPLPLKLFRSVVQNGLRLPPKSTFFHPKIPTGLVINTLRGGITAAL